MSLNLDHVVPVLYPVARVRGKMFSKRSYDYHVEKLEFTYENFDKEIDDLQREIKYIKNNPNYILETHCAPCLEWDLNTDKEHDVKNINFILELFKYIRIEFYNNKIFLISSTIYGGILQKLGHNRRNRCPTFAPFLHMQKI